MKACGRSGKGVQGLRAFVSPLSKSGVEDDGTKDLLEQHEGSSICVLHNDTPTLLWRPDLAPTPFSCKPGGPVRCCQHCARTSSPSLDWNLPAVKASDPGSDTSLCCDLVVRFSTFITTLHLKVSPLITSSRLWAVFRLLGLRFPGPEHLHESHSLRIPCHDISSTPSTTLSII